MAGRAIGVLGLQGAFDRHEKMLAHLNIPTLSVRYPEDLARCVGLIIPGGESTTMTFHILENHLKDALTSFASQYPVFGTCAGMILMAQSGLLKLLDITVKRNAYGRQAASFSAPLNLSFSTESFEALFIRAPKISQILSSRVSILASLEDLPVLIQQDRHLAASFHPELTEDARVHRYFASLCGL